MYLRSLRPSLPVCAIQWHTNAMHTWSHDRVGCMGGGRGTQMGARMCKRQLERVSRGAGHTVVAETHQNTTCQHLIYHHCPPHPAPMLHHHAHHVPHQPCVAAAQPHPPHQGHSCAMHGAPSHSASWARAACPLTRTRPPSVASLPPSSMITVVDTLHACTPRCPGRHHYTQALHAPDHALCGPCGVATVIPVVLMGHSFASTPHSCASTAVLYQVPWLHCSCPSLLCVRAALMAVHHTHRAHLH